METWQLVDMTACARARHGPQVHFKGPLKKTHTRKPCHEPCPDVLHSLSFRSCPPHVLLLPPCCPSSLLSFSSWRAPLMLSYYPGRCPVTACPSFILLVCSWCFPSLFLLSSVVLLMSSFVFPLSCCCCALDAAFRGWAWGCGPPPQQFLRTKLFGVYAGIIVLACWLSAGEGHKEQPSKTTKH